jgi:rare lipoprotein A
MLHTSLPTHRPRREVPPLLLTTVLAVAVALVGCASGPKPGGVPRNAPSADRDGADANPPKDLALVPDAEPRVEGIRSGGPNRPYEVLGRRYVPITQDRPFSERGLASWYGRKFHGRPTASGETYDMYGMTAAHPTMPLPSYARVRNPANGREVIVRVNDRGPFHPGRIIDLSYTAALKLGLLRGVAVVEVERLTHDSIRARNGRGETVAEALSPQADEAMPSPAPVVTGSAPLLPLESDAVASGSAGSESKGNDKPERAADKAGDGIEKADPPCPMWRKATRSGCSSAPFGSATAPRPSSAASLPNSIGPSSAWRCSTTPRSFVFKPAPMPAAARHAARPSAFAVRCSWCPLCWKDAEAV